MIVNKEKCKIAVTDILLVLVSLIYRIGVSTSFAVCDTMEDNIMSCHWAGEVLKAISLFSLLLSFIHLLLADGKMKTGMDISCIGIWLLAMNIPGNCINICKMATMDCRRLTVPWTIGFTIVMILLSLADGIFYGSLKNREKHKRKDERK